MVKLRKESTQKGRPTHNHKFYHKHRNMLLFTLDKKKRQNNQKGCLLLFIQIKS